MADLPNISARQIVENETLVRDNYDKTTKSLCALKLVAKTERLPAWSNGLKSFYDERSDFIIRSTGNTSKTHDTSKTVLKVKNENSKKSMTINIFTTGTITIQGDFGELLGFETMFDDIKRHIDKAATPGSDIGNRPVPVISEANTLLATATDVPDFTGSPQPVAAVPKPQSRNNDDCEQRVNNLEHELLQMDKRFSSQLEQVKNLTTETVKNEVASAFAKFESANSFKPPNSVETVNALSESHEMNKQLQVKIDRLLQENGALLNERDTQKGVIDAMKKQLAAFREKLLGAGETETTTALGKGSFAKVVQSRPAILNGDSNSKPDSTATRPSEALGDPSDVTGGASRDEHLPRPTRRLEARPEANGAYAREHSSDEHLPRSTRRRTTATEALPEANGKYAREDSRDDHLRRHRRPSDQMDEQRTDRDLQHLVIADSMTRGMKPRDIGKDVRIKTMGGKTISDATAFLSSSECPSPTKSVTFHVGVNDINHYNWDDGNENDLIEQMMDDYDELIKASKRRFPAAKIYFSHITMRGDGGRLSATQRDSFNQTVDVMNDELTDRLRREQRIRYIPHHDLNATKSMRRDGLHLDDNGLSALANDVRRCIIQKNQRYSYH